MGFSLPGQVVTAVDQQLQEMIKEQILAEQMAAQEQERAFRRQLDTDRERRMAASEADDQSFRAGQVRRQDAADAAASDRAGVVRRAGESVAGLQDFPADVQQREATALMGRVDPAAALKALAAGPPTPKRRSVTANIGGKPVNLMAGEDEAVEEYREPKTGPAPDKPEFEWVIGSDGEARQIRKGTAQKGDRPYDATAERNKPNDAPSPYASERANRTIQSINELIPQVSRWTTGVGSMLSSIPETEAKTFKAQLDTLKANIAFNELTAMREASKTGGALGQVSNVELGLLQSALGALDTAQSPRDVVTQLEKIRASVERWQQAKGISGSVPSPGRTGAPAGAAKKFTVISVK